MAHRVSAHAPGHWVLARAGKKVLRPGGKETTQWLLDHANIAGSDVVEFAPGLGLTAAEIIRRKPRSYIGVEADPHAAASARRAIGGFGHIRHGSAVETGLDDNSADIVVIEAMLSMHSDKQKRQILREAVRILRPHGLLLSHEFALVPDSLDEEDQAHICQDIARAIHVNARPLTNSAWSELAACEGLETTQTYTTTLSLLEPRRLLADEGWRVPTIVVNVLKDPQLRAAVRGMRAAFRTHRDHLGAIGRIYSAAGTNSQENL